MNEINNELRASEIKMAQNHFKKTGLNPGLTEDIVIALSSNSDKKTIRAALCLIHQAPLETLDIIKALAFHSDASIRTACFNHAAAILKDQGTGFYVDCLNHPNFREKANAVNRIWRHGDASAIPAMTSRLNRIIKTRKGQPYCFHNGESELTQCLEFLHPHRDQQPVRKLFDALIEKWTMLDQKEAWWITDQLEYFSRNTPLDEARRLPCIVRILHSDHPIFQAAERGDIEFVTSFLEQGGSVYSWNTNRSLSKIAISTGNIELLKLLIDYRLNIERPIHGFGDFPVISALRHNKNDIANHILEMGIDVNRQDEYGQSLFMMACCGIASQSLLQKMVELGANIHDRRYGGITPFMHASRSESIHAMEFLLNNGADINESDDQGKTALVQCAQSGKLQAVEWLINHGANLIQCEERERDALYWAKHNKHEKIEMLIQSQLDKA